MFASLMIVFSTVHEGGALVFRHGTGVLQFDSATAVAQVSTSSVAFAAFYSDVEDEVAWVSPRL